MDYSPTVARASVVEDKHLSNGTCSICIGEKVKTVKTERNFTRRGDRRSEGRDGGRKQTKFPSFRRTHVTRQPFLFPVIMLKHVLGGKEKTELRSIFYLFIKRWITLIPVPWSWFIDIFSVLLIIEMSHCIRRFSTLLIAMTNWGVPSNQDSDNFPILM